MNEQWRKRKRNQNELKEEEEEEEKHTKKNKNRKKWKKCEHSKTNTVDLVKRRITQTHADEMTGATTINSAALLGGRMKCTLKNVPVYRRLEQCVACCCCCRFYSTENRRVSTTTCVRSQSDADLYLLETVFRMLGRFFIRSLQFLHSTHVHTFIYTLATSINSYMVCCCGNVYFSTVNHTDRPIDWLCV